MGLGTGGDVGGQVMGVERGWEICPCACGIGAAGSAAVSSLWLGDENAAGATAKGRMKKELLGRQGISQ